MTYLRQFVVSFACVAVIVAGAHVGAEPLPTNSNESTVLQRFEISKCGEIILLPVQIEDKTYPFFLDTGAARTVFDISLPIGKPSAVARVGTADKHIRASVFTTPRASVGKLSLDSVVPDILGLDLSDIRTVGCDLNGIIGADFLKHHVVQIDFDRGELIFLKNVEAIGTIGTPIDLSWDDSGCPTVSIRCGGQDVQRRMCFLRQRWGERVLLSSDAKKRRCPRRGIQPLDDVVRNDKQRPCAGKEFDATRVPGSESHLRFRQG